MRHSFPVWYAAYTNSRAEKKVACELAKSGIEHYLPLRPTVRQWNDRKKRVEVPLITSYIFVNIVPAEHFRVLKVPGLVKIINFCGKPVPIPVWQIDNLKILMGSRASILSDCKDFKGGKPVRISRGPLTGLRGIIRQVKGQNRLVVSINAIDYNLFVDIDPAFVESVKEDKHMHLVDRVQF